MDSRKQSRPTDKPSIRLQKYLAECGVGSRRACERVIEEWRVAVDGNIVKEQGTRVDPGSQIITVDGYVVRPQRLQYILLNKPRGVICTSSDEKGRPTIHDLLPVTGIRVYNVGRLDRDSEGLLLVTNDGDLAARLMHPKYHIPKTYRIIIERKLDDQEQRKMIRGVKCESDVLHMFSIEYVGGENGRFEYEIVLKEGKNRQIRRMMSAIDVQISRLRRIRMGSLALKNLPRGKWRYLTEDEISILKNGFYPF